MPYFQDLHDLLDETLLWADLRHEQGAAVQEILKRLRKDVKRARKDLCHMPPGMAFQPHEPNGLEQIRALRPRGPRRFGTRLNMAGLEDKMKGAWAGRAAGCTLGVPVENWPVEDMERLATRCGVPFPLEDYWPDHPNPAQVRYGKSRTEEYLKGGLTAVPVDDDVTYTLLGLLILETYGPDFTTHDVGQAWLQYLPMACTAEDVALRNLKKGIAAVRAGAKDNPFQEWIGADIRSDPWGYAAPGWPEKAAEYAYRDAYLSHRHNGIYGAMFFAAAIAASFVADTPSEAIGVGLTEIPEHCRLAHDVQWALETAPSLRDWRAARAAVDERFHGMHAVHTNNNACLTVFGLLMGGMDFTKTIGITVAMGLDNDCTAATAGSILGAMAGAGNIPAHWWKPFRNRTRTYMNGQEWFRNTDVVRRFIAVAKRTWETATCP